MLYLIAYTASLLYLILYVRGVYVGGMAPWHFSLFLYRRLTNGESLFYMPGMSYRRNTLTNLHFPLARMQRTNICTACTLVVLLTCPSIFLLLVQRFTCPTAF
jgi:hypothetical protein